MSKEKKCSARSVSRFFAWINIKNVKCKTLRGSAGDYVHVALPETHKHQLDWCAEMLRKRYKRSVTQVNENTLEIAPE